eukprot:5350279-Pleurochrysis_carterae.AAC.1
MDSPRFWLGRYKVSSDCLNNADVDGGGQELNILINSVYERLLQRCADGYYAAVMASPLCSTFSVSRFLRCDNAADGGPPPVRDRDNVMGLPTVPAQHQRELQQANEIVRRTANLLRAAYTAGAEFVLEQPADRGALASPIFLHKRHAPIWLTPDIIALKADAAASYITFPQCALGATSQKYTSLLTSLDSPRRCKRCPICAASTPITLISLAVRKQSPDGLLNNTLPTLRT